MLLEDTAVKIEPPSLVFMISPKGARWVEARAVLVATGSRDLNPAELFVGGSRPAGVYTTAMAWRVLAMGLKSGRKASVLGHGEAVRMLTEDLIDAGVEVVLATPFDRPA